MFHNGNQAFKFLLYIFQCYYKVYFLQVHAFVKRDAEAPQSVNYIEKYQKEIQDFSKDIGNKLQEAFNPDEIKKGFSDIIDNISKAVSQYLNNYYIELNFK